MASSKDPRQEMAEQLEMQQLPPTVLKESVLSSLRQSRQASTNNQNTAMYIPPRDTLEAHMIDRSRVPSYMEGRKRQVSKKKKTRKHNLRQKYLEYNVDPSSNLNQPTTSRDPNNKTSHSVYMTSQQSKRPRKSTKEDVSAL
eukprot:CAMPEP_0170506346 /NCGR_PEP_ID=MMETSP0208-20121228/54572_1 /TAXON_ID=197538 /ORGANISM="Strombidium inclinatum, Strain S3" /LENGTH=141 /DNA_ID=CAMNT_0010787809 /DNA_START=294 /DNA_END=719 /DNA_ORIENTATION=-